MRTLGQTAGSEHARECGLRVREGRCGRVCVTLEGGMCVVPLEGGGGGYPALAGDNSDVPMGDEDVWR
jgi:hypothetical protein